MAKIITIASGKPYEFEIELSMNNLRGKKNRKKYNKLMAVVFRLASSGDGDVSLMTVIEELMEDERYEDIYIPLALNPTDNKEIANSLEKCIPMDLFEGFMEAIGYLINPENEDADELLAYDEAKKK